MSKKSRQLSLDLDQQPNDHRVMVVGEHPNINPKARKILHEALLAAGFDPNEDVRFY
jgi:hypothetical protein